MTFEALIVENQLSITKKNGKFSGDGWKHLLDGMKSAKNVLIGEDHFMNEIPELLSELIENFSFDCIYTEIDPYSLGIIQKTFEMDEEERNEFNRKYSDLYSFFAKKVEYDFLKKLFDRGTRLLGADQIVMYADRLIFDSYVDQIENEEIISLLNKMSQRSEEHLEKFKENPSENPMYFMTPEFLDDLSALEVLEIADELRQIISDMRLSVEIYQKQNHNLRVKLLLHQLMKDYELWKDGKNLFKYGANHMTRGESFLFVHDIGNMVANISRSQFENSFYVMMIGYSGEQGSPFRGFPNTTLNAEEGLYLKQLKPFFNRIEEGDKIYVFNLRPIRLQLIRNKIKLDDINLVRVIKGFDTLVIFPEVTASQHFER